MCSSYLGTSSSTNRLCAWAKGTDTCQGDSGGPLTVAEGGKYTLLGVVSYGAGCASSTPGIYARVQGFLPWIQSLISSGECSTGSTTATTAKPTKTTTAKATTAKTTTVKATTAKTTTVKATTAKPAATTTGNDYYGGGGPGGPGESGEYGGGDYYGGGGYDYYG